ncbi:MAG: cytochrome P450 [Solirubrobacterales bacterium]
MPQKLPPGPPYPAPVQMLGFWNRPLAFLEGCRARYGKRFTLKFPATPSFVVLTEPDQIKEIYTAPPDVLQPGVGASVLTPLVGRHSVILLDGESHMSQRKLMLPAFHGERMERLHDLVARVSADAIESWRAEVVELHPRFQELTLEIILRAVFGLDPGPRLDALRRSLASLLAYGDSPMTLLPPPDTERAMDRNLRLANRVGPLKGFLDRRNEVDALLAEQIADRRAAEDDDRDDVLSMLLAARHEDGSPMSAQELRDELMTLLVAGHETTASTLAWTFSRLSREPRVLSELVAEVDSQDDGPYLTATIQEALRSRPVLPNTAPRFVAKPITVGGWDYEPGCSLVANAYLVHHDADLYPDPYSFRPERFLGEKPGTYTWIPFGGGRRRCLGSSFAMLEVKIVLAEILRRYEIRPATGKPELARRRNITVRPGDGARVSLGDRERSAVAP